MSCGSSHDSSKDDYNDYMMRKVSCSIVGAIDGIDVVGNSIAVVSEDVVHGGRCDSDSIKVYIILYFMEIYLIR